MARDRYRRYASSLRAEFARSQDPNLFPELNIPKATIYYWMQNANPVEVSCNEFRRSKFSVETERLRSFLTTLLRGLPDDIDLSKYTEQDRRMILSELEHNRKFWAGILPLPLRARLSIRLKDCEESPDGLCVRRFPGRLSKAEVWAMRHYVESPRYAHLSIASLILLARRNQDVICNGKTWYKYIRRLNWSRPTRPAKKTFRLRGVHAVRPHQYWHVDASIIDLPDGVRRYLQVIIDNYSRFVLEWRLLQRISGKATACLIGRAKSNYLSDLKDSEEICCLVSDGGPENNNDTVRREAERKPMIIFRLAKKEIWASNSMVESFFKALKHQFLCYRTIHDVADLNACIAEYVEQHNNAIPYAHLDGRTPRESLMATSVSLPPPRPLSERMNEASEVKCRFCR